MTVLVRSELLKFFSTRLWWGILIPVLLGGGLFTWLTAALLAGTEMGPGMSMPDLDDPQMVSTVYSAGLDVSLSLLLAIGVLTIGAEYRHKTITATFLATPRRARVMGAKVISLLALGALYGLAQVAASFGVGAAIISGRGYDILPEGALRTLALCLLVLGLWALIGLGIGILIPNQVAALFVAIGVAWIVEPLLAALFSTQSWGEGIVPYLPGQATSAVVNTVPAEGIGGGDLLSWWAGALVLLAYAAVLAGLGTWRTLRTDIS
jgi:ABC-type transport system involved in multi-copper enzyme maturation permease subunit